MPLTEQELRQQLETAAGEALPPRFAVADLTGRIRRRRRRNAWTVSASIAAVAAVAVALPLGLGGSARPDGSQAAGSVGLAGLPGSAKPGGGRGSGPESEPAPRLRELEFEVTVNGHGPTRRPIVVQKPPKGCGHSPADACPGSLGTGFFVTPGETLHIRVAVAIPARARVADLWLGISHGTFGFDRTGPVGLAPILAHIRTGLEPGRHAFRIAWTVPANTPPRTVLWLGATWSGELPIAAPGGGITSGSISTGITVLVTR